jgi:exodeoxyribonuclease VII large subunit
MELQQRAERLAELRQRLPRLLRAHLASCRSRLLQLSAQLRQHSPAIEVAAARGRLEVARTSMMAAWDRRIESAHRRMGLAQSKLHAISPLATLQRGYAIVTDDRGTVVTDAQSLQAGAIIRAKLSRGEVQARVEQIKPPDATSPESESK